MFRLVNEGSVMWFLTFKIISLPVPSRYPTRQALVIAQIADEHWNARFVATSVRRLSQKTAKSYKWDDIVSRTSCWLFWVPHSMPLIIISNTKEDTFKKIAHPVPPQAPFKKSAPACLPHPERFWKFSTLPCPKKNQVLPCHPNPPQNISSCPIPSQIKKMLPQTSHVIIFDAPNMVEWGIPEKIMDNAIQMSWPSVDMTPCQKLRPNLIFARFLHCNYKLGVKVSEHIYGSIMLKNVLQASLT